MKNNEWGESPGTQDNLLPEDAPMLSELECSLINVFRGFPEPMQKEVFKSVFNMAYQVHNAFGENTSK